MATPVRTMRATMSCAPRRRSLCRAGLSLPSRRGHQGGTSPVADGDAAQRQCQHQCPAVGRGLAGWRGDRTDSARKCIRTRGRARDPLPSPGVRRTARKGDRAVGSAHARQREPAAVSPQRRRATRNTRNSQKYSFTVASHMLRCSSPCSRTASSDRNLRAPAGGSTLWRNLMTSACSAVSALIAVATARGRGASDRKAPVGRPSVPASRRPR